MYLLRICGCAKVQLNLVCLIDTALHLVLLRRKIKALENPMFLGTTGERTIFQIMTRHGADIGSFSVRPDHLLSILSKIVEVVECQS